MSPNFQTPSSPRPVRRRTRPREAIVSALLTVGIVAALSGRAAADELPTRAEARQVNDDTVGIVFHYEDNYRRLAADMAERFDETHGVRVVPIIGLNHVQTIYDMLYMRGVDLGIVHSDVFEYMARIEGYDRVYQRINSLAEIATERVAVIAGEGYRTFEDLAGEKVNFGAPGKGGDITGSILFDAVGVEVERTRLDKLEALEQVKSGEIAAMVYLVKEPTEPFSVLSPADGVRLIGLPQDEELLAHYRKARLTSEDFPELIKGEGAVPSLQLSVIVAAYNWPASEVSRYEKAKRFATALVDGIDELKAGDEELWKDASIESVIPGVERLGMVDEVIDEREARAEREAAEAAAERLAELEAQQRALMARLEERLESGTADAEELGELETLIEQMETVLDQ